MAIVAKNWRENKPVSVVVLKHFRHDKLRKLKENIHRHRNGEIRN